MLGGCALPCSMADQTDTFQAGSVTVRPAMPGVWRAGLKITEGVLCMSSDNLIKNKIESVRF